MKITCKECTRPCCEGWLYNRVHSTLKLYKHILPLEIKRINIEGMSLIRISNVKWRCEWFNKKTGRCTNYKHRPDICREYLCSNHKKGSMAMRQTNSIYGLMFPTRKPKAK